MKQKVFEGRIIAHEWKGCTMYGNSYFRVVVINDNDERLVGQTAYNAQCGYVAREGMNAQITYHITRTGNVIIDYVKEMK